MTDSGQLTGTPVGLVLMSQFLVTEIKLNLYTAQLRDHCKWGLCQDAFKGLLHYSTISAVAVLVLSVYKLVYK